MAFRFKQFTVEDALSTIRIGTDAILLGAWADPGQATSVLEIGTGCGVISLMLAQKTDALIDAIDIDEASVKQAGTNFRMSPWSNRLTARLISLQDIISSPGKKYDCIITNPPFFIDSLKSPDVRKTLAKHTASLDQHALLAGVVRLLKEDGCFFLVLPPEESKMFSVRAEAAGLFLQKQLSVKPKTGKPVNRVLSRFGFMPCSLPYSEELIIRNEDNTFTKEYIDFTVAYYFSLR
jgi:tRNA1Val (adenine37-N6)-methyltransferase